MKILGVFNNEYALELFQWLENEGHETVCCLDKLNAIWCRKWLFDLAVNYTYRYILSDDIISSFNNAIGKGTYHALNDAMVIKSVIDTYDLSITEFRERLENLGGGYWISRRDQYFDDCCQVMAA